MNAPYHALTHAMREGVIDMLYEAQFDREPVKVELETRKLSLLQSLRASRQNILSIIPKVATQQKIVSGKTGKRWHMVMDPPTLRHVLLDALDHYPKSVVTKSLLKPAIGESLFIAEGDHWRWQRRTAAPVFTHRNMLALAPIMTRAAERAAARIDDAAGRRAVNMLDEMINTTFDVIADVTFSGDDTFDRAGVHRAIEAYIDEAGRISLFDVLGVPDWIPRPGQVFSAGALRQMKAEADRAIDSRTKRRTERPADLLDLLKAGSDPKTGRRMSTAELRDNLLTFIVAGHETTALTLAWALYLVAFDPAIQRSARVEAQRVLGGRAATGADVEHLPMTRMIIDEALRLYPPAGVISRTAQKPDRLCGTDIRPGDTVMVPVYALHRSELLWDEPNAFRPERFEDRKSIDRYAYLPFGDGPRICIGMAFALQEAVIILATLLSRFKFTPVTGKTPKPVMIITLRPEGGVWLEVERL